MIPPTLPKFYDGQWSWMPYEFLRVCNDDGAALLLAYVLYDKEVAERDRGFPLDEFHPFDEQRAWITLSTAKTTLRGKMTVLRKLGFVETRTEGNAQLVKIFLDKIQTAVGNVP